MGRNAFCVGPQHGTGRLRCLALSLLSKHLHSPKITHPVLCSEFPVQGCMLPSKILFRHKSILACSFHSLCELFLHMKCLPP